MNTEQKPVALIIMDGFGLDEPGPSNAISLADTPFLTACMQQPNRFVRLEASGEAVGLPAGQMGNSEVGHLNIGAGRVVHQELTRINHACESGALSKNSVLVDACSKAQQDDAVLHLMGLLSDGGVHSSQDHLFALIQLAVEQGVKNIHVHCFMDGRDVPPSSGKEYLTRLNDKISSLCPSDVDAHIASLSGRYYAMDRDNRWDRIKRAYDALVACEPFTQLCPLEYLAASYDQGITDEFIEPASFTHRGIQSKDSVIFFNFRPDRARQITRCFTDVEFNEFPLAADCHPLFVCLTEYDPLIVAPVAFPKEFPENVLADVVSDAGLSQFHIAETEKYAHVTFFFNGGREQEKVGEQRCLVPSPKVATYDLLPSMSQPQVTEKLVAAINDDKADLYIVNFANCDMVGHTGSVPAAIQAVEAVDSGVKSVVEAILAKGGIALVTADHGNADKMIAQDGTPFTAHTTAPVPFILCSNDDSLMLHADKDAALCDIAPTVLSCMGIHQPSEMTGKSLLVK